MSRIYEREARIRQLKHLRRMAKVQRDGAKQMVKTQQLIMDAYKAEIAIERGKLHGG